MFNKPESLERKKTSHEYDPISYEYANITETDPSKRFVQYPESLRLVGDVQDKKVLDIGCGSGKLTRMLASRGAKVIAYDISKDEINLAKKSEEEKSMGIQYFVSDFVSPAIKPEIKFDIVSAILVLPTAKDKESLEKIIKNIGNSLALNGKLVCMNINPDFKRFGEILYNRRFTKKEDGNNKVEFFRNNSELEFQIQGTSFTKNDYEEALKKAGFNRFDWETLHVSTEAIKEQGEEFWDKFEEDCPYIGLVAYKD